MFLLSIIISSIRSFPLIYGLRIIELWTFESDIKLIGFKLVVIGLLNWLRFWFLYERS